VYAVNVIRAPEKVAQFPDGCTFREQGSSVYQFEKQQSGTRGGAQGLGFGAERVVRGVRS
jgi:hypothetical protein